MQSQKQKTRQATEIWRMLDNLSQNDPVAYRKFIKEQMDIGKTMTAPPKPNLLVRASTHNSKLPFIYILLCSWSRIPKNQTENEPINVIGGEPYEVIDNYGRKNCMTKLYPLAFSEETCNELVETDQKQLALIDLSLEFIKTQRKVNINTNTMYEICGEQLIGAIDDLYASFKFKEFDAEAELKECFGDPAQKTDLLKEISQLKDGTESEDELKELKLEVPQNRLKNESKILIEELNEPIITCNRKSGQVRVEIPLPNISSMADVELDISETALHLEMPKDKSFKLIELDFPSPISIDSCDAKFLKKNKKLIIVCQLK